MADSFELPGIITHNSDDDDFMAAPQASTHSDINQANVNALVACIRKKQHEQFSALLQSIPNPGLHLDCGGCDADGNTVMHLVVLSGDEAMMRAALEAGGSVNSYENEDGDTPLMLAAHSMTNLFPLMLHEGKKVKAKRVSSKGQNILHSIVTAKATARSWPDRIVCVRELLTQYVVSIKQTDNEGFTPAEWARQHFLGLGNDAAAIVEILSKSQSKRMNATRAEFILFFKSPVTRLVTVVCLMVLHSLQYATETFDRPPLVMRNTTYIVERWPNGTEVYYPAHMNMSHLDAGRTDNTTSLFYRNSTALVPKYPLELGTFPFVFRVLNMIGAQWYAPTSVIAAHIGCLFIGALLGAAAGFLLRELLRVAGFRIFGADAGSGGGFGDSVSDAASTVATATPESQQVPHGSAPTNGIWYAVVMGMLCGIFCSAHLYNYLLSAHFDDERNGPAFAIPNTIGVLTNVSLLRGCWVLTLLLDWLVLIVVLDTVMQQLHTNTMVPDAAYNGFGSLFYQTLPLWRKVWALGLLPLGWIAILIGFGAKGREESDFLVEQLIHTTSYGIPLAISGLSILFAFFVVAQDWSLPYRKHTADLSFLALADVKVNMMWFLWVVMTGIAAMDFRLLVGQIQEYVAHVTNLSGSSLRQFELAAALFPALFGILLLVSVVVRTNVRLGARRAAYVEDETRSQSQAAGGFQPVRGLGRSQQRGIRGGGGGPAAAPTQANTGADGPDAALAAGLSGSPGKKKALRAAPSGSNKVFDADQPARPPSSSAKRSLVNDVWTAAAADDVIKLCMLLEKDPSLINARGGPGLECDSDTRTVTILPPSARGGAECAAAPIHYAIAAGARSTLAALLSRGANLRLRTVHGMFSCEELVSMMNSAELNGIFFPPPVAAQQHPPPPQPSTAGGGGSSSFMKGSVGNQTPQKRTSHSSNGPLPQPPNSRTPVAGSTHQLPHPHAFGSPSSTTPYR